MLQLLGNRTYARLLGAQVIALLGTGLLTVALGLLAFDIAGDAAGSVLGTALTIKMLAYVGLAPLIAALVDRLPRKTVLVTADLVRLAIALMLPFVTETWQIYALVFLLQSASATFTPAFQSLIPAILPDPRDYTRALSLSRLAYDLESLLSPVIAALLLMVVSYHNLFVGTALGFALSAMLVRVSSLPAPAQEPHSLSFWQRLPLGLRVFARTRTLRFLLLTNVVVAAGTAVVLVNSVVYVRGVLGRGEAELALTLACFGAGSLVAALSVPRVVEAVGPVRTMMVGTIVITTGLAAALLVTAATTASGTGWGWLMATWVVLGVGTSLVSTPSSRLLAEASAPTNRTLVYTAQFALSHACFLLTYPVAGWVGAMSLTLACTMLLIMAAVAAATSVRYAVAQRLHTVSGPEPGLDRAHPLGRV